MDPEEQSGLGLHCLSIYEVGRTSDSMMVPT